MVMKYVFILGRNPTLSVAEIIARVPGEVAHLSREALVLKHEGAFDGRALMNELGGTIKIGEVKATLQNPAELVTALVADLVALGKERKLFFGISLYPLEAGMKPEHVIRLQELGITVKRALETGGVATRFVRSRENALSSVVVAKNKLLTRGVEFLVLVGRDRIVVATTSAVQSFEEFSFRDYGRPARRMAVGLIPPKLARAMVNLARALKNAVVLDPFCGFGTVATEAMLMGYQNLIASDIEAQAVEDVQKNIAWIHSHYPEARTIAPKILQSPAEAIAKKLAPSSVDAIVTEPYLGPVLHGKERPALIQKIIRELSALYVSAFRDWKKILKPDARVVIVFPVLGRGEYLPILEDLTNLGYRREELVPDQLRPNAAELTKRGSILYSRPGQKVMRELFVFTLKT